MVKVALVALVIAGCYDDRYRCDSDADCDVAGGRCEVDRFCTKLDTSCRTQRRYQHAGEHGDDCFDDAVAPINACAGGQTAARPDDPCIAKVCDRMHACCDVAWTDACAQLAQQECEQLVCDTRIAIVATKAMVTELWDVRWVGDHFTIDPNDTFETFAWVGPAPADGEPRLAGARGNVIEVGDLPPLTLDPGRTVQSLTTAPVGRDRRDTIAIGHVDAGADPRLAVFEPELDRVDEFPTLGAQLLTWGDIDRDGLPDPVTKSANQYFLHDGALEPVATSNVQGGVTNGAPAVRQIDWLDFDGDGELDLAVFGSEVRLHTNGRGLRDTAEHQIDCDPPSANQACKNDPEPNLEEAAFGGVALPDPATPSVVLSMFPGRRLFRVTLEGGIATPRQLAFPGDSCTCTQSCDPDGTNCNYNCNACVPVIALIARDLDGDHATDLIAIDARLDLYTALAPSFIWQGPTPIPTALPGNLQQITTSVTGVPR